MWNVKHGCVFKNKDEPYSVWHLALCYFSDSAIHGWPCCKNRLPYGSATFFEPIQSNTGPKAFAIFDLDCWEACSFDRKSWLFRAFSHPLASAKMPVGLRFLCTYGPEPVVKIAARQAFWNLGMVWLSHLAHRLGLAVAGSSSSGSLSNLLFALVQHILKVDDAVTMTICCKRLGINDVDLPCAEGVLQLDEAIEILEKPDHQAVQAENTHLATQHDTRKIFTREYQENNKAITAADAAKGPAFNMFYEAHQCSLEGFRKWRAGSLQPYSKQALGAPCRNISARLGYSCQVPIKCTENSMIGVDAPYE